MNKSNIMSKSALVAMIALMMNGCGRSGSESVSYGTNMATPQVDTMLVLRTIEGMSRGRFIRHSLLVDKGGNMYTGFSNYYETTLDALYAMPNDTVLFDKNAKTIVENLTLRNQAIRYIRGKQK